MSLPWVIGSPIDPSPVVVEGDVSFSGLTTGDATITQESIKAIVDYDHFNVLAGDAVRFTQPAKNAVILNRINNGIPSVIDGSLTANGQVYFVNPAGVTFGENSFVRADLFLAAAGNISDDDFLSGVLNFDLDGEVVNLGDLNGESGVYLLGERISNLGKINSEKGVSLLASGDELLLKNQGSDLVLSLNQNVEPFSKSGSGIHNLGSVDGEEVMFSAGDAFSDAIYHGGQIESKNSSKLHSDGGNIKVSGEILSSNELGGGRIEIGGTDQGGSNAPRALNVSIFDTAFIDASAKGVGDGGDVVVWSDNHTEMFGSILATGDLGGFAEVSGNTFDLGDKMRVNLGEGGRFLLDPVDVIIDGDLSESIVEQLNNGTSVTISTQTGSNSSPSDLNVSEQDGSGDITVTSDIRVPAGSNFATLSLKADRDINVQASDSADSIRIQNLQTGSSTGGNVFSFEAKRNININGIIDNFGGGDGNIFLRSTDGGDININARIDANKGGFIIHGTDVVLKNATTSLLAGGTDVTNNRVQITADNELKFDGGRLELFGDTDVLINAQKFNNLTGSNVFAVNAASADSVQWSVGLPKLYDENNNSIHTFGGLKSNNNAAYGSAINTNGNGNISIKLHDKKVDITPTNNQYHFANSPSINITAKNDSKIYGNVADNAFSGISINSDNLINADDFAGVFTQDTVNSSIDQSSLELSSTGAAANQNVGSYNIVPSKLTSPNGYTFNYISGNLTVDRREITLTASDQSKIYGDELSLGSTAFSTTDLDGDSVLPNGELVKTVTLVSANGVDASTDSDVGTYADNISITPTATGAATLTGSNGFDQENYDINYLTGDLTINRRAITLTASGQEKSYGDEFILDNTAFKTLDKDGDSVLPNEEVITNVSINSTWNLVGSTIADVGIYENEIEILSPVAGAPGSGDGFRESNYDITYVPGDLTINRRDSIVIIDDQKRFAGQYFKIDQAAFILKEKLPNHESIEFINISSLNGLANDTSSPRGYYPDEFVADKVIFGTNNFESSNYNLTFLAGDLEILPYPGLPAMLSEFDLGLSAQTGDEDFFDSETLSVIPISDSIFFRALEYSDWLSIPESDRNTIINELNKVIIKQQTDDLLKYYLGVEYAPPF